MIRNFKVIIVSCDKCWGRKHLLKITKLTSYKFIKFMLFC